MTDRYRNWLTTPDPGARISFPNGMQIHGPRLDRHREMVANVCATARKIVSDGGIESLSISRLCDETSLSRQTIHNNIGNRNAVLVKSLNEYTSEMVRVSRQQYPGIEGILFCMEGYAACAEQRYTYLSQCIRFAFTQDTAGPSALYRHGVHELQAWLDDIQTRGELRAEIDINDLARQLVLINSVTNYEWVVIGMNAADLRKQLPFRIRSTLRGCATVLGQAKIQAYELTKELGRSVDL